MQNDQQYAAGYPAGQAQQTASGAQEESCSSSEGASQGGPANGTMAGMMGQSYASMQPQPGQPATGQPQAGMMGASAPSQGGMGEAQAGPEMGQPHFSAQFPGAAPYQGAPVAGQSYVSWQYGMQPEAGQYGAPQAPVSYPGYAQPMQGQYMGQQLPPNYYQGQVPPQAATGMTQPGQAFPGAAPAASAAQGMENRYGELYGLIQQAADGNPDVSSFLRFFQSTSSDFWKGALVGTGLTLLLTNDTVKSTIAKTFAGIWGAMGKSAEDREAEEDRKAEEQARKEAQE